MRVRLTRRAEADLDGIAGYIARDNPPRAATFIEELYDKCMTLADAPEAFPLIPRYESLGVRRRVHGDYLILFAVKGQTISILRVLHGARDYLPLVLRDR